jgi:hypothetical protein
MRFTAQIQADGSSRFAARDAAHNLVSVTVANAGAKSHCEHMSLMIF